jgi:hypothetical protein
MALIWGKKVGKNGRLPRKIVEYSQLGDCTILFALSMAQYWIFRRGARNGNHFRSKGLKIYLI